MIFEATALSARFPRGRKPGTLEVINGALCFRDHDNAIHGLPLQGGKITQGGAGNRYIYFTHPSYPDLTFYTDDKAILNLPEIKFDQAHAGTGRKIKNNHRLALGLVYTFLGLIVALVLSLLIFRNAIVEHIASLITPAQEQEMASGMKASAIAGKTIINDTGIQRRLGLITAPLVAAVEDKSFKFSFTIIEDPTLNAFALPGGAIIIHSGLILKAKTPEEIAGVLAHEISHVTRRHHVRGIIGNLGIYIIVRGFLGDISGVSAEIATAGATLSSLQYSRSFEIEADETGWKLLTKAGVDPKGMLAFFETMKNEQGKVHVSEFLSTHPATEERIRNLKEKKVEHDAFVNFPFNFEQFKNDIDSNFKNKKAWK
jgi:Zn-dependent protease with chaperone function